MINTDSNCIHCVHARIHILDPHCPADYNIKDDEEISIFRIYCPEFGVETSDGNIVECNRFIDKNKIDNLFIHKRFRRS